MSSQLEAVRDAGTILLTTYKRDGTPVGTPVYKVVSSVGQLIGIELTAYDSGLPVGTRNRAIQQNQAIHLKSVENDLFIRTFVGQ